MAVKEEESFRICSIEKSYSLCLRMLYDILVLDSNQASSSCESLWVLWVCVSLLAGRLLLFQSFEFLSFFCLSYSTILLDFSAVIHFFFILWSVIHCQKYNCKIILHLQKNPANVNIVLFCFPLAVCCLICRSV